jgi:hypothetical protein
MKVSKFTKETNSSEETAREYLAEFNNNVESAIGKFKERQAIIKKFS